MNIPRQNGLTLVGFLLVLGLVIFFAYAGMRLVPMYLEYHALGSAMDALKKDPAAASLAPGQIKQRIQTSLWVSYASGNIGPQHIRIIRKDGVQVRVKYEVRKPFLGNIDLVGKFDRTVVLR
ncbi:MAG: DUF4845 domain-containing protein [Xanthomonadales bacterium]|nr:DUF4845 domain-containing protein [Xanthomonadales bacterium]